MPRSLKVSQNCLETVKNALPRNGFARQTDFAIDLQLSQDTVRKFFNGYSISCDNFFEICRRLDLEASKIARELNQSDGFEPNPQLEPPKLTPTSARQKFEPVFTEYEIEREPQESQCLYTILQPGSFLRIKGPQNMGKTRLLNRVLAKVKDQQNNCQIVIINWQIKFDRTSFKTYEQFLKNFCVQIDKSLRLPNKLNSYWDEDGTPQDETTAYFYNYLLPQVDSKLILVLEDMDRVFDYSPIAEEFCSLLRGFHLQSRLDPLWQKLNLVIVHSTDKYASLKIEESPLDNVGETVTIQEFIRPEVDKLIEKYELSITDDLEQLIALVNQHPFLINLAFKEIAKEPTRLKKLLSEAATQGGIYHQHLLKLWNILKNNLPLKEAFKQVVNESTPVRLSPELGFQLESLGLVKISGNLTSPRCPLYRQYFPNYL